MLKCVNHVSGIFCKLSVDNHIFNSDSYEQPSVTALSEFCDYVRFV